MSQSAYCRALTGWGSGLFTYVPQRAAAQESAKVFVDGEDITNESVSASRVVTGDELLMQEGVDSYIAALNATRVQLQQAIDRVPE